MKYHGKLYGKLWDKYFDTSHTTDEWDAMEKKIADLEKELEVTNKLLEERQKLLDSIPECNIHGKCVPHALDWIQSKKQ